MANSNKKYHAVLPLRDIVVFPDMVAPLFVGRKRSINALEDAIENNKDILLVTQKNSDDNKPTEEDMYRFGTVGSILQLLRLPDGTVKVLVEGKTRARITEFENSSEFFVAEFEEIKEDDIDQDSSDIIAVKRSVVNQFKAYAKLNKKISSDVANSISSMQDPIKLGDTIAAHLNVSIDKKQKLLEITDVIERLEEIYLLMASEIEVLNAEGKIKLRVKDQMDKSQREYYLNEQLKAIHKELNDSEDGEEKSETAKFEERIENTNLSEEANKKALSELKKLGSMSPLSAEATVVRNYLEWLLDVPWNNKAPIKKDLPKAKETLDEEHYGLEKVKERILEYLAVQQRTSKLRGPVLCLVGPPGVGKTSLAKSIAEAIGRKYAKVSLGGVRDESEIRGHRRTYIGSMPGKIIQSMKKSGVSNPLILLDEIDKMGQDFRGDPASALLEVLDPEQNNMFNDHYLEVDYDLSDVMFVCTSNSLDMPQALYDRLEIIRISGYTEDEKVEIAKNHLIDRKIEENGLQEGEWSINEDAIRDIIRYYTREAGVRSLEREISNLTRKAVKEILMGDTKTIEVTSENIDKYSGIRKFNFGRTDEKDMVGIVNGLAYSTVGGDLLTIEALKLPGKGTVKSTGKLGDVMQESAQAAFSYAKSRAAEFGIQLKDFQSQDIHIHVPEGATPKDGPSAGIAMFTAIVSVMNGIEIKKDIAMTGEITLRGRVLPIGGLKEKLLGALRGGAKTVLIPLDNKKDLEDVPDNVKGELEIIPVEFADQVIKNALVKDVEPILEEDIKVPQITTNTENQNLSDSLIT